MLRVAPRGFSSKIKVFVTQALLLRLNVVVLPNTWVVASSSESSDSLMQESARLNLPIATFLTDKNSNIRPIGTLVKMEKVCGELLIQASGKLSTVKMVEKVNQDIVVSRVLLSKEKPMEHSEVLLNINSLIKLMNKLARQNLRRFETNIRSSKALSTFFSSLPYMAEIDLEPKKAAKELFLMVHKAAMLLPHCSDGFEFSTLQSVLEAERLCDKISLVKRFYSNIFSAEHAKELSLLKATEIKRVRESQKVKQIAIKLLQEEMGPQPKQNNVEEMRQHFEKLTLPEKTKKVIFTDLERFSSMQQENSEFEKLKNYLNNLMQIPFDKYAEEHIDIAKAEQILHKSHYGMEKVKQRIIEFLAVKKLKNETQKGGVILLLGPPGVGKSSIGKTIAQALNRPARTISLGGCAEAVFIKGHSRTYVGSKPGVFVRELQRAGVMNPVFIIDEVDKMGSNSLHGDPQSALLDALNEEQNDDFHDDYLDTGIDLSKVLFILTANNDMQMLTPLRNRLEVINLPPYLPTEKVQIAKQYLLPEVITKNGIGANSLVLGDGALHGIIKFFV